MNSDFVVALHAMTFLYHKGTVLNSEALAANVCTNPARVRRVMARLRKAGLVETREGRADGGYRCDRGGEITLEMLADALKLRFPDVDWKSGDRDNECLVSSGMSDYMDLLNGGVDGKVREFLRGITVADVEKWLVANKERKSNT